MGCHVWGFFPNKLLINKYFVYIWKDKIHGTFNFREFGAAASNSSNHCTRQRIFIMYSYLCIMFYFCMRHNFFLSHQVPGQCSLPPLKKLHHTTPNLAAAIHQSAHPAVESEEALYLHSGAVRLLPLICHRMFVQLSSQTIDQLSEVALCCCHQSYQEKSSCCLRRSVRLRPLICHCMY